MSHNDLVNSNKDVEQEKKAKIKNDAERMSRYVFDVHKKYSIVDRQLTSMNAK